MIADDFHIDKSALNAGTLPAASMPANGVHASKPNLPADFLERQGKFSVPMDALLYDPAEIMQMLSGCLIIRAEIIWERRVEYTVFNAAFDVVPFGAEPPQYDVLCCRAHVGAPTTFEWKRRGS